ncbi:iron-containing alcohol dehydrogenase family protein [Geomicrobium sp. JSM 1781026]|uniref:iron-containing alcohol dehydrogenase family protein n=1 Tax=Geomicrobium sp. JSM 1781026 TaxID=3344580 RepID=UPI0035C0F302
MNDLLIPRIIRSGAGRRHELHTLCERLEIRRLLIVMSKSVAFVYEEELIEQFKRSAITVNFFLKPEGEPTMEHVNQAVELVHELDIDGICGLGGGSVLDLAKAVSVFALDDELRLDDVPLRWKVQRLPLIAVPTTAGTGSEATKVMVITDKQAGVKKNPAHPDLIPDVALLDPELTSQLPKRPAAYAGLDALAHAIEAYCSTKASLFSNHFAEQAIQLFRQSFKRSLDETSEMVAREQMLIASCYAGIAFSNSSTNLAHAMARPLGNATGMPHGLSVALLLPYVVSFGEQALEQKHRHIARLLGNTEEDLLAELQSLNEFANISTDARTYLHHQVLVEELVSQALQGNGIRTNCRVPTQEDIYHIYEQILTLTQNEPIKKGGVMHG